MSEKQAYTLLYDGSCPFCKVEINNLKRLDKQDKLGFIDITREGFSASQYHRTQEALMSRIHAIREDGETETGMDVLRNAYSKLGLGWLIQWTSRPVVRPMFDKLYERFAAYRVPAGNLALKLRGYKR